MNIYQSEIDDGLRDQVLSNNTLAWDIVAESFTPEVNMKSSALEKIIAENKDQIDLYYLRSILVSTGWNKNDDVFHPQELWNARNTPEDKPFNFMHDERDIIGHITGNAVIDKEGNEIVSDEQLSDTFNILTTAVVYTEWSDSSQRDRMRKIVAEIEEGKWFVSMECLFPDFDYALIGEDGRAEVITRDEASAFLTKHLRAYGGDGQYDNYRVGRLLRNLSFSGKGLVSKPANPNSIILDRTGSLGGEDITYAKEITLTESKSYFKEREMSDSYEKQIDDLRAELAEAKSANEVLQEKVAAEQQAEFDSKISAFEVTLAEKDEQISGFEARVSEAEAKIAEQAEAIKNGEKDAKEKMEELREMKKKEARMKRKAALEDAGLESEAVESTLASFEDVDDDTFAKVLTALAMGPAPKRLAKEEEEKKKAMKMKEEDAKADETVLEEEVETSEASEADLESVEETEEVAIAEAVGEDDPAESLRAQASEWLGSVLQSVPKDSK
jgi:chemotaxis protein histidine kinase CheA